MSTLPHLTFLLTEHCNLTCRSCGHFSTIAAPKFADAELFRRDLARLALFIPKVENLWLMGGEPLLHPTPENFVMVAREIFPEAKLWLTTSGVLLKKMRPGFWKAFKAARATLEISAYPPFHKKIPELRELCDSFRIPVIIKEIDSFTSWMNLKGDSNPTESFQNCKLLCNSVPLIRDARLFACSVSGTVRHLNQQFQLAIPEILGLDLLSPEMSAERIFQFLRTETPACRFCAQSYVQRPWAYGDPELSDWSVE